MNRLLLFNLRIDVDDHILGFTTRWINGLAPYFDHIDVITMHKGRLELPDNVSVYSVGRERGAGRFMRVFHFYRLLLTLLTRNKYVACFSHMTPLFTAMGGVILRLFRVPITTWYTHRNRTRQLQVATWFSRRCVTAVETSYPIPTEKKRPLGHGIDTDFYQPNPNTILDLPPLIVLVARITPIKRQHLLIEAVRDLPVTVALIGGIPDSYEDTYMRNLQAKVNAEGLNDKVHFIGEQTAEQVRSWYQRATIAVNLSPIGLFDKAPLESMACGVPTLVSNPAFGSSNGHDERLLILDVENIPLLRQRLITLLNLTPKDRLQMSQKAHQGILTYHSLTRLLQNLVRVLKTGEVDG